MAKVLANIFICGTSCYTDQGTKNGHSPKDYGDYGYIPVGLFHRVKNLSKNALPVIVPGPGEPFQEAYKDLWIAMNYHYNDKFLGRSMEDLAGHVSAVIAGVRTMGRVTAPKSTPYRKELLEIIKGFGVDAKHKDLDGAEEMKCLQFDTVALELLVSRLSRDNVKIEKGDVINLCGHSRGAVTCIIASHDLNRLFPGVDVNIFAIDPVPGGGGNWTYEMTHLAPNVKNYVGVYAIDEASVGFNGVVPWPSSKMQETPKDPLGTGTPWKSNPKGYMLFYSPGRHATVAGMKGEYGVGGIEEGTDKLGAGQEKIGYLVGSLAMLAFRCWGAEVEGDELSSVYSKWKAARKIAIDKKNTAIFREMRRYSYDSVLSGDWNGWNPFSFHWAERGVSSTSGKWNASAWCYLEDALGHFPLVKRKGYLGTYDDVQRRAANWDSILYENSKLLLDWAIKEWSS